MVNFRGAMRSPRPFLDEYRLWRYIPYACGAGPQQLKKSGARGALLPPFQLGGFA